MKLRSPELIETLAARYVLGVLKGPARSRFEREMMCSWRIRQEVWFWERQLQPLAGQVPAITPPARAWKNLHQQLWPERQAVRTARWTLGLWQGWSVAATAAACLLALALVIQPALQAPQIAGTSKWLAVVQSPQAEPLWLVDADENQTNLRLKAIAAPAAGTAKDFELWLLPSTGQPLSIGLLPSGDVEVTLRLSPEQFKALLESKALAISVEPKGGSPTGLPTGPVVYQSRMLKI